MKGKKKMMSGKECAKIRNLFDSARINPAALIDYLERTTKADEIYISLLRENIARSFPNNQNEQEVIKLESENTMAQMLVCVLKVALMESKAMQYVNPSLN